MSYSEEISPAVVPLLETKFFKPSWRTEFVARPRLIEQLQKGINKKLTLISAPAGSGKTTLLAEYLAQPSFQHSSQGWLSLDERDNDPVTFWTYFIKAIKRVLSALSDDLLMMIQAPQTPPIESILTSLINEVHSHEGDLYLMLDDYHLIEAKEIHDGVAFFLSHLPQHMHLIVASRTIPPLPLSRLRARSQLLEVHAHDLRFSQQEAAAFFNDLMDLNLTHEDINVLEDRTEGWVAGLQLAALSIQGKHDKSAFIEGFSGDDRYILDYLLEEVLTQQAEEVRNFLIQTSILDRLHASLCDATTHGSSSHSILALLEKENLFLIPLDEKRHWYRYHHLFAEVLYNYLLRNSPNLVPELHRRASDWYASAGFFQEAVHHALKTENHEWAATMIEKAAQHVFARGQGITLNSWLDKIPIELLDNRPVLSTWFAWKSLDEGHFETAGHYLTRVESWLEAKESDSPMLEEVIIVDKEQLSSLPGIIATSRSLIAQAQRNIPDTLRYARQALDVLPENNYLWRGGATAILGLAAWAHGDLQEAYDSFSKGLDLTEAEGLVHYKVSGAHVLARLLIAQGNLQEALKIYEKSLALSLSTDGPTLIGTGDIYRGIGELKLEFHDLKAAEEYIEKGKALGRMGSASENAFHWPFVEAKLHEARGNIDAAFDCLDEAEKISSLNPIPDLRPIAAFKVRLWLSRSDLQKATQWIKENDLSVSDELNYNQESDHITLCRILIARHRLEPGSNLAPEALNMLERLYEMTARAGRLENALAALIQLSLGYHLVDNLPRALSYFKKAIEIAQPQGYVRIFLDEGKAMHDLLRHAATSGTGSEYARQLLQAFEAGSSSPKHTMPDVLSVPLTKRELEILRLIASGMKNQQIADHLFISLATVKRHIANVYNKIDVDHRTQAVARAKELQLI